MKTNSNSSTVVGTVPTSSAPVVASGFTVGLDLGDQRHFVCVLDAAGQVIREGFLTNTRPALLKLLADFPHATVAMEAGTHSPWISRFLSDHGGSVAPMRAVKRVVSFPPGFFNEMSSVRSVLKRVCAP